MAVGKFVQVIVATLFAILAKLATSIDDLIWLIPFVSEPKEISKRFVFGCVYIIVMSILNILAIIAAGAGESVLKYFAKNNKYWDSDRILSVVAGTFLLFYSFYLFFDWKNRKNEIDYIKTETDGYESETPHMLSNSMTISNIDNDNDSDSNTNSNNNKNNNGGIEMAPLDDQNENKIDDATKITPSQTAQSSEAKSENHKIIVDESISEIQEDMSLLVDKNDDDNKQDTKPDNTITETNNNHNNTPGNDNDDDDDDDSDNNESETIKTSEGTNIDDLDDNMDNNISTKIEKSVNVVTVPRLCVVSVLGGMDDFSVHVGMLLAKVYTPWELMIGVLIGSIIVIFFSIFLSIIKPIARIINRIPIWLIIFCIANYRLISAFAQK